MRTANSPTSHRSAGRTGRAWRCGTRTSTSTTPRPTSRQLLSEHIASDLSPEAPAWLPSSLRRFSLEQFRHGVPVDYVEEGADVVGALVLVFQIVGVLPYIQAENRMLAVRKRHVLIRGGDNLQFLAFDDQPRPAT